MAIVIENQFSDDGADAETEVVTREFTPAEGELVWVSGSSYAGSGDGSATLALADSAEHEWLKVVERSKGDDGSGVNPPPVAGWITWAAGVPMTVTLTKVNSIGYSLYAHVACLSGVDPDDPVAGVAEVSSAGAPLALEIDTTGVPGALLKAHFADWLESSVTMTATTGSTLDDAMANADIQSNAVLHKFAPSEGLNTIGIDGPGSGTFTGIAVAFRPASATLPAEGEVSSAIVITGTATGSADHEGAAGTGITITGTATGQTEHSASVTAGLTLTGSATGARPSLGSASSALKLTGSVTGARPSRASASGGITITGTAVGVAPHRGTVSGVLVLRPAASGERASEGLAAGVLVFTGSAESTQSPRVPGVYSAALRGPRYATRLTGPSLIARTRP